MTERYLSSQEIVQMVAAADAKKAHDAAMAQAERDLHAQEARLAGSASLTLIVAGAVSFVLLVLAALWLWEQGR